MMYNLLLVIIQSIIIVFLLIVIIYMIKYNQSITKEKRIRKYSIEPVKSEFPSASDKIKGKYKKIVIILRKPVGKIFKRTSKRYEKYVVGDEMAIDYVTNKLILATSFVLLATFALVLQKKVITGWEIIIYFFIGFFVLDIVFFQREKHRKKLIENEMLRAIIIMNNSFKSGKSTLQAVKIASLELPPPISLEFKKMYKEMVYGLSIDAVFERFSKRINIEEVKYVASSLIVLNKTGGNIIKVFSSIERTLYERKKLQEEKKNLTVSSNLVVKVLLIVPFVFVLIIYILNPSYFDPLFESTLGYLILGVIIIMFSLYIWFLEKIVKVKV